MGCSLGRGQGKHGEDVVLLYSVELCLLGDRGVPFVVAHAKWIETTVVYDLPTK